mmetsp:Transcript_15941/g.62284  ORF Transcript_15941/g.62284 Transcript_15941/m.62284 type:complete len:473 (-) Transcript_15941:70-1488(-)|eukprot:CAMPEP_0114621718 /NCGR_PEP_ID=MMETSP0168-20121206/9371_1 /TAXON_ID=95228 ORGANISM="Vannella sp., Strain DIVA3 517/6/12" /NCGR_SAMPLE_ID=MMETSP0168 /ASSEMBLY_ACC=CAM_ASM_000044 /LENGTH=472 /DNA_ID=CAMNT_0001832921 /DNA_START=129 /DNA_END=1547 /DNA_ORIENTATION=-
MAQLLQRFRNIASPAVRYSRALPSQQYRFNQTSAETTKVSTLKNGLRVVSETCPAQRYETSTIAVVVNTGSSCETAKNNGVAHFLEHLAFKGTEKRTATSLELEVENMGATLNAYTSREHTVYTAKVFKQDVDKAVDILADIIQNPKHSEAAIEQERGVILREMKEVESITEEAVFDHLHAIAFQGSPLSYTILGPKENINSFTKKDFAEYIQTHYTADRMVVVGTGAVDHGQLEQLAEAHFAGLNPKSPVDFGEKAKSVYTGSALTIADDRTNGETTVAVAVEGAGWASPDHVPLLVIQAIVGNYDKALGGGKNLSSRLGELVATEDLARSFSSFNTCYNGTGLFGNYFVTTGDKTEDMTCEVLSEYVRIAHDVSDAEVERAKRRLKSSTLMQADGPSAACDEIGRQMVSIGRRVSPASLAARIDAIDTKTIRDVATRYFTDTEPSVVAVGDVTAFPDYNQIRGWTHWWRV